MMQADRYIRPLGETPMIRVAVPSHRSRSARRALASTLAAAVVVSAAACADESESGGVTADVETVGDFEATAAYLQKAAEQSTAEGYRMELLFSLSDEVDADAPPLMSGEVNGDEYHYVMDLGSVMDQMAGAFGEPLPPEFDDIDMTMEMAGGPESLYLRAPMFAGIAEMAPTDALGPVGELADLGDGWGYIDMAGLGDQLPSDLASAVGAQGVDPQVVIDMIASAEDVEDLGSSDIRDTAVNGLAAEVTLGDLVEASGQDPDALAELGGVGSTAEDVQQSLYETTIPVEVWVDGDGYLRRMSFGWGFDDIAEALGEETGDLGPGMEDMHFTYMMDMFDYGTTVDFEAPADAVDITDAFAALARG
jgi:hypothetical protein